MKKIERKHKELRNDAGFGVDDDQANEYDENAPDSLVKSARRQINWVTGLKI